MNSWPLPIYQQQSYHRLYTLYHFTCLARHILPQALLPRLRSSTASRSGQSMDLPSRLSIHSPPSPSLEVTGTPSSCTYELYLSILKKQNRPQNRMREGLSTLND